MGTVVSLMAGSSRLTRCVVALLVCSYRALASPGSGSPPRSGHGGSRGTCGDAYRDVKELLTERGVQVDQAYVRTVSLGASTCMSIRWPQPLRTLWSSPFQSSGPPRSSTHSAGNPAGRDDPSVAVRRFSNDDRCVPVGTLTNITRGCSGFPAQVNQPVRWGSLSDTAASLLHWRQPAAVRWVIRSTFYTAASEASEL
jgi:hypothetical protein